MSKNIRWFTLVAALAVVLAAGLVAQQKAADTAIDPVCGMTVVKANAKATFDYKGMNYYFCSTGCKESFAKDPEKYLKAQQEKAAAKQVQGVPMPMGHMQAPMGMMKHEGLAGCPMCGGHMGAGMGMGRMGRMPRRMGPMGHGPMAPGLAPMFRLYGDKIEVVVENTKDGALLKVTSKDPEVAKAIQVHMAEHVAMMKKMKEAQDKAGEGMAKMCAEGGCAGCATVKK